MNTFHVKQQDFSIERDRICEGVMRSRMEKHDTVTLHSKIDINTFQSAMNLSLKIAQCFGLFPIHIGQTRRLMTFRWLYWRTAYSILTFVVFVEESIKLFYMELPKGHNILNLEELIFFSSSVIQFILMFELTLKWPVYVGEWHKIETKCRSTGGNLKSSLNCIVSSILSIATVEHFLINAYNLKTCFDSSLTMAEGFEKYFLSSYSSAFIFMDYSLWRGIIFEFVNLQMAFIWNYVDVFIMLIGMSLKFRLNQVTQRVKMLSKVKVNNMHAWRDLREDYLLVVSLCHSTNKLISSLIVTSFMMNLYFILKQIFKSLMKMDDSLEKAYFYLSFGLLVTRIFCVIMFGSGVHDEWREIGLVLHDVPTVAYNTEVERFISNVTSYELVLSGKNFFSIRRSLILQIAGTIVTYELVLIQFNIDMLKNSSP